MLKFLSDGFVQQGDQVCFHHPFTVKNEKTYAHRENEFRRGPIFVEMSHGKVDPINFPVIARTAAY